MTHAFLLLASVDTHCALAEIKDNIDGTIQSYAELITVQHSNSPRIPNLSMFHMEFFFPYNNHMILFRCNGDVFVAEVNSTAAKWRRKQKSHKQTRFYLYTAWARKLRVSMTLIGSVLSTDIGL